MEKEEVIKLIKEVFEKTPGNIIGKEQGYEGEPFCMYEEPIAGFSSAEDSLYEKYKEPGIIGPNFMAPKEWLSDANTVVSIFFPFSKKVKETNAAMTDRASLEWAYARVEGQAFIDECMRGISQALRDFEVSNAVPLFDERFGMTGLVSNWSERHAAYVSGLGTFGKSKGIITRKGMAGRFGSVIISLKLEADERDYTGIYDYCIDCGACAGRCPADAFDKETGFKNHALCEPFVTGSRAYLKPRYGCGLCQTKVPCQDGIPGRA